MEEVPILCARRVICHSASRASCPLPIGGGGCRYARGTSLGSTSYLPLCCGGHILAALNSLLKQWIVAITRKGAVCYLGVGALALPC